MNIRNRVFTGHWIDVLKTMPSNSIDTVITSPPYWGLRSYAGIVRAKTRDKCLELLQDKYIVFKSILISNNIILCRNEPEYDKKKKIWTATIDIKTIIGGENKCVHKWVDNICVYCGAWLGQLGLESTPQLYIEHLIQGFNEIKRVLKNSGTCWVNLGDTYSSGNRAKGGADIGNIEPKNSDKPTPDYAPNRMGCGIQNKSLVGIPERFMLAMIDNGWILRNTIIWHKPNAMPECLSKSTRVYIKRDKIHITTIDEVTVGDNILSQNGWVKVLNVWKNTKKVALLDTGKVDNIKLSYDHRIALKYDKRRDTIHYNTIESIKPPNKDNKTSNYVVYADISKFLGEDIKKIDITDIELNWFANLLHYDSFPFTAIEMAKFSKDKSLKKYVYNNTWSWGSNSHNEYRRKIIRSSRIKNILDFDKVKINNSIEENRYYDLDYDFGWLIGIYIAEGGFNQPRGYQGKVTFHINEVDICKKFVDIFERKFLHTIQQEFVKNNYRSITFVSPCLYALTKTGYIVSGKCKDKSINIDFLLNTPKEFRKGILDGYIDGDGHRLENRWSVASVSNKLIADMQLLCTSLGILTSKNTKNGVSTLWSNSYHKFNNEKTYVRPFVKLTDDEEEMIDIEVEGGTFVIENGLISHNSAKDRFTRDFEYLYFFSKNQKYYFEQQFVPHKEESKKRAIRGRSSTNKWHKNDYQPKGVKAQGITKPKDHLGYNNMDEKIASGKTEINPFGSNKRCVWSVTLKGIEDSHFAIFPEKLIETPIKACCPQHICLTCGKAWNMLYTEKRIDTRPANNTGTGKSGQSSDPNKSLHNSELSKKRQQILRYMTDWSKCDCQKPTRAGIVLDPFMGSGTVGIVALNLNRNYCGIELNPDYTEIYNKRIEEPLRNYNTRVKVNKYF